MNFKDYSKQAVTLAVHETELDSLVCSALGLFDEFNEYYMSFKAKASPEDLKKELGDIYWYAAVLSEKLASISGYSYSYKEPQGWAIDFTMYEAIAFIQGRVKKIMRDYKHSPIPFDYIQLIHKNLDVILYKLSMLCAALESSSEEVMEKNLDKLFDRKKRGVIQGDGDNR